LRPISFDFDCSTYESTYEKGGAADPQEKQVGFARGTVNVRGTKDRFEGRYRLRERSLVSRGVFRPGMPNANLVSELVPQDVESEDVVTAKLRLHLEAKYRTGSSAAEFDLEALPRAIAEYSVKSWAMLNAPTGEVRGRETQLVSKPYVQAGPVTPGPNVPRPGTPGSNAPRANTPGPNANRSVTPRPNAPGSAPFRPGTPGTNPSRPAGSQPVVMGANGVRPAMYTPPPTRLEHLDCMLQALFGTLACDDGRDIASLLFFGRSTAVADDKVDGIFPVKQITGNSSYGSYIVWLDTFAGNAPRHIQVHKTDHHLFGRQLLRNSWSNRLLGNRRPNGPRWWDYQFEVDKIKLETVPGSEHSIMTHFEIRETTMLEGSNELSMRRTVVKLSNVRFECADYELDPVLAVPDGTTVRIEDAPDIKAEWRNRAVFKVAQEGALERFEAVDLSSLAPRRNIWLIGLNGAVFLALVYVWFARRRHAVSNEASAENRA